MKNLLPLILVCCMIFVACKKKESPAPEDTNQTNPPQNINGIYGQMETNINLYYSGNTLILSDTSVYAGFYTDWANPSTSAIPAGIVKYNDTILNIGTLFPTNWYGSFSQNIHQLNSIWSVSGNANVPVINYTMTTNYPTYTGYAQIPDTFSISNGFTFNLTNYTNPLNFAAPAITITDNTNSIRKDISNLSSCSFSAADLSVFTANTSVTIRIAIGNSIRQTFAGKDYLFSNFISHNKLGVYVKP